MLISMSSLSLFAFPLLFSPSSVSSQSYHDTFMNIKSLSDIQLPTHSYGGVGGIFHNTLYLHSGFDCTQYDCPSSTVSTIFLLDLHQTYLNTSDLSLYWSQRNVSKSNWSHIDYEYTESSISIYSGLSATSSSTQLGAYSYIMHPGSYSTNIMLKYDLSQHQYTNPSNYDSVISSTLLSDACTVNDGNQYLYSIGGRDSQSADSAQMYRYDTLADLWQILSELNVERFAASCVLDATLRSIYILGGDNAHTKKKDRLSSIETYDIQTDTWRVSGTNLIYDRYKHVSVLHPNHWIVTIGGVNGRNKAVGVELFDPSTDDTATTNIIYDRTQFYYAMHVYPTANVLFLYGGMNDDGYYDDVQYIVLSSYDPVFPTISPTVLPSKSPTIKTSNTPSHTPTVSPTNTPNNTQTHTPTTASSTTVSATTASPTNTANNTNSPSHTPYLLSTVSSLTSTPTTLSSHSQTIFTPNIESSPSQTAPLNAVNTTLTILSHTSTYDTDTYIFLSTSSLSQSSPNHLHLLWTLFTSEHTYIIISALILIICMCGCCLFYYVQRSRKYRNQLSQKVEVVVKALKIQKPTRNIQFPQTIPSKSSTGTYNNTYIPKRDSGLYETGYSIGALASSPSSYLSSSHNRSYNSNAMTRPSPSATGVNRQIGYRANHISIPMHLGIGNFSDDGEDSTGCRLPLNKPSICNSNSMSSADEQRAEAIHQQNKKQERSYTEWKHKQQQIMSYRNQMQWQLQLQRPRARAVSYGQYQYQPYYYNYNNGYYMQNNNNRNTSVPPPPPVRLPAGVVNNNHLLHVPQPLIANNNNNNGDIKEDDDDEGDSVSTDIDVDSSTAHSRTQDEDADDDDDDDDVILSEISPMNSKYKTYSSNSLMEQKAQELDAIYENEVTIRIKQDANEAQKRRVRQMIVFKPQTEMLQLNHPSIDNDDLYRFEPGALPQLKQKNESQISVESHLTEITELVYDENIDSLYDSRNDVCNDTTDSSSSDPLKL